MTQTQTYQCKSMSKKRYRFVDPPYPDQISKDQLDALPVAKFQGQVRIIDTRANIKAAISELMQADALGIDTETKPCFIPGKRNQVSLLQISTDEVCYLFRLNKIGMPEELIELLEDPNILKVGLSLKDDKTTLRRLADFEPKGFVELQSLCPGYGIRDASLQKIYGIIFSEYMSKGQRMSNWEATNLSPAQQHYAALDAWACLRIYRELMTQPDPAPVQFALL